MKGTGHTVEELIRLEAYLLSEKAGHPHGMQHTFWAQAEAIVHGRVAAMEPNSVPKIVKRAPATTTAKAKALVTKAPAKAPAAKKTPAPATKTEKQLPLAVETPAPIVGKPATKKTVKADAPQAKVPAVKTTSKKK